MVGRQCTTGVERIMSDDLILLERDGAIATVIINNPAKRNALSLGAWDALCDVLEKLNADDDVRCVIVRGAGDKAFAAGADIKEFPTKRANAAQAYDYGESTARALDLLQNLKHPTVAMIRGACTGGGLEIAACCDMRIASDDSKFGVPINRIGHAFAPPELRPVLDLVGKAVVLELLLEGQIIDAATAYEKGLLSRVVAADELEANVAKTASNIAKGAPLGARMTKRFVNRLCNDPSPFTEDELRESYAPCDAEDYTEGYTAFMEKRSPEFKGK
jgi:enoyl-CoA hydratase